MAITDLPVWQAGMGGGIARHELAAAVSEAGGLGTIGILPPAMLRAELRAARGLTSRPIAVNLLLPFTRREHASIAAEADVVVTFWGAPRRLAAGEWWHQCGSVQEARAAVAAGADGVIAQGVEAGGHVRGTQPALELLERVRAALGTQVPVAVAGGIADAADVRAALDAGAVAAVLGTRFLMTPESHAHPQYRERVQSGSRTIYTDLFGAGWPAPHRVLPNAATTRWLADGTRETPSWVRRLHRTTAPVLGRLPQSIIARAAASQRPGAPMLGPQPPTDDGPEVLLEAGPLYAGETTARIDDVRPAADLVRALAP
jgi:NAD(P)H-dependent flavin oxidoreductase YrpB (nitropropane dioxygenase family)